MNMKLPSNAAIAVDHAWTQISTVSEILAIPDQPSAQTPTRELIVTVMDFGPYGIVIDVPDQDHAMKGRKLLIPWAHIRTICWSRESEIHDGPSSKQKIGFATGVDLTTPARW